MFLIIFLIRSWGYAPRELRERTSAAPGLRRVIWLSWFDQYEGLRSGFRPVSSRESLTIGPPAGRDADCVAFPIKIRHKFVPESRFTGRSHYLGGPLAGTHPFGNLFSKPDFGVQRPPPGFWETHQLWWGAKPPTSIVGFPGGKRPLGRPKYGFEKNLSKGWVLARGPPVIA
jgi:hypothetical protein